MKNILVLILSLIAGLFSVELISRTLYDKPWHQKLLDEMVAKKSGNERIINALGLRDKDYSPHKPENCVRVLILGDSFTFGSGVADNDSIFPELLEKKLNEEFSQKGKTIEILNGGISGSLTNQWVDLLEKVKYSFKPDIIQIVFFLRDGTRTSSMGGFFGPIRDELKNKNQMSVLYQYSYVFRVYQDFMDRNYLSEKYSKSLNESYLGGPLQTEEWEIAKENIRKIKTIGDQLNSTVSLVVFPILVELNDNYPFQKINNLVVDFALQSNLQTHNLLPAFKGKNGPDLWVSPFDQHPNTLGHEIAANSILPFLRQLVLDRN